MADFFFPASRSARPGRHLSLCFVCLAACFILSACASSKATQKSPELPPRHWLGESPGVPIRAEQDKATQSTVPLTLYSPDKTYNFEDCVYLAIQQSPLLVKSSIQLEMSRLDEKDAAWRYLPELHMNLTTAVNLTQYNTGNTNNYGDYGKTIFRASFYAPFPDPLSTYFTNKAQQAMTNIAVLGHRKAIGMAIMEIADGYLQLQAQKRIRAELSKLPAVSRESTTYWKAMNAGVGGHTLDIEVSQQNEKQVVLQQDKSNHIETMMRTKLKTLLGLSAEQRLTTDTDDNNTIFQDFDGNALNWEDRWNVSAEYLSQRMALKLQDYNIMLAWAKYMPTISLRVDNNPPAGQAQPYGGREDTFLHLNFDFTLLDWGSRYRGVQKARMEKAIAFQAIAEKRTNYINLWEQCRQASAMARTNLELAKSSLRSAELQQEKAEIEYKGGTLPLPELTARRETVIRARVSVIEAELEGYQARLKWLQLAGMLEERFMDQPERSLPHQMGL